MNPLLKEISFSDLMEMGFVEEHDGSGDPRGTDYNIRNDNFHILVDAWGDVSLTRRNPDTDSIPIKVESKADLQFLIDWIAD